MTMYKKLQEQREELYAQRTAAQRKNQAVEAKKILSEIRRINRRLRLIYKAGLTKE